MGKELTQKICPWKDLVEKDKIKIKSGDEPMLKESDRNCYQCGGTEEEMSTCSYLKKSSQEKKEVEVPDKIQELLKNRPKNTLDYRNL